MNKNSGTVKRQTEEAEFIWQDREIRFDVSMKQLSMQNGE